MRTAVTHHPTASRRKQSATKRRPVNSSPALRSASTHHRKQKTKTSTVVELSRSLSATEKLIMRLIAVVSLLVILTVELRPIFELISAMGSETQHILATLGDFVVWALVLFFHRQSPRSG
jgi:hypothetical protein